MHWVDNTRDGNRVYTKTWESLGDEVDDKFYSFYNGVPSIVSRDNIRYCFLYHRHVT